MVPVRSDVLERLAADVRDFATPRFQLGNDLRRLQAVVQADAPEAVILYCARILEALSADAVARLRQVPSPNVFSNLQTLEWLGRAGRTVLYWAHALRRLGNVVRHLDGLVGGDQARLAVLFGERWLQWYFCDFSHGCRLASLTRDGQPLGVGGGALAEAMCRLEELEQAMVSGSADNIVAEMAACPAFTATPILPAVLADILLSRRQPAAALGVLKTALARFDGDLRLQQLMGLCLSRQQEFSPALQWLEPLRGQSHDDGETAGITAGVYKRIWLADRTRQDALKTSHQDYRRAWEISKKSEVYVGINAATTALWLDHPDEARQLATDVENVLRRRAEDLPSDLAGLDFQFWDQLTLAEARLLQGDWPAARNIYENTFHASCPARGRHRSGSPAARRDSREIGITTARYWPQYRRLTMETLKTIVALGYHIQRAG